MSLFPVLGLMSGTSIDGIDASLVYTNGTKLTRTNFNSITKYSPKTKQLLNKALDDPKNFIVKHNDASHLSRLITIDHSKVVNKIIKNSGIKPFLIGFHGQTIFHNPQKKISIQLGDGNLLSKLTKINVVYNFRSNDIKNGGQGAPIAPIYHQKIIEISNSILPTVIINIGGIANLSYWDGVNLIGFDIGPGNNLMDYYMKKQYRKPYDNLGKFASKGRINYTLIKGYLQNSYFLTHPPKSLERADSFNNKYLNDIFSLSGHDCMATLCALSAFAIKDSFKFLPSIPKKTIIVGGGKNNKFLIKLIKETALSSFIITGEEAGLPSDFIEAELIALLSARKYYNLPSTFPSTTGVKTETILGDLIEF